MTVSQNRLPLFVLKTCYKEPYLMSYLNMSFVTFMGGEHLM